MKEKLEKELAMLKAFQTKQKRDLDSGCEKEKEQLLESIAKRRAIVEEKVYSVISDFLFQIL